MNCPRCGKVLEEKANVYTCVSCGISMAAQAQKAPEIVPEELEEADTDDVEEASVEDAGFPEEDNQEIVEEEKE